MITPCVETSWVTSVFGLAARPAGLSGGEMLDQLGDPIADVRATRRPDPTRRLAARPSSSESTRRFKAAWNCWSIGATSGCRSGSLAARAIRFSQSPSGNDDGLVTAQPVQDVLRHRGGRGPGAFLCSVLEPAEIGRAGLRARSSAASRSIKAWSRRPSASWRSRGLEELVDRPLLGGIILPPDEPEGPGGQDRDAATTARAAHAQVTHLGRANRRRFQGAIGRARKIGDLEQPVAEPAPDLPAGRKAVHLDVSCRILDRRTTHPCCWSPRAGTSQPLVATPRARDIQDILDRRHFWSASRS